MEGFEIPILVSKSYVLHHMDQDFQTLNVY